MSELAGPALSAWQSFYVIVGSSGAALIGIQFVVVTLIAAMRMRSTPNSISAFGTPTVVHLAGALLVSAVMSAPWRSLFPTSVALVICGLGGLAYSAIVIYRARRPALALAAVFLCTTTQFVEFVIGAAALGLLLIGIHNAWDSVTHIVFTGRTTMRR